MMTDREIQTQISELKNEIQSLEKLKNRVIVADGSCIITAYFMSQRKKRNWRKKRDSNPR